MNTTNGLLGLNSASPHQGLTVIPAGTLVHLVMKIRAGTIGLEGLCKRTAKGDAEFLDVEFTVKGGDFDKRKLFANLLLNGTTAGHAKAAEISRTLLRAIFEAAHGIDPNDNGPATHTRRTAATLAAFEGATFLATVEIEAGGKRDGGGFYKDKNTIGKVLRVGDKGYRRLEQPPPVPIERSAPAAQPQAPTTNVPVGGAPAVAPTAIARPIWAKESQE